MTRRFRFAIIDNVKIVLDGKTYLSDKEVLDLMNDLHEENQALRKHSRQQHDIMMKTHVENAMIVNTILDFYHNERTELGRSVLRQLAEALDLDL